MSETVIVELNARNAEYSRNNEYRCQLAQPIIINEGDQLSFRMASIDVLKTSPDTVIISNDTNLSAVFSYVDVDYSLVDKLRLAKDASWAGDNCGNPTFDYYAGYNDVGVETLTGITGKILGFAPPVAEESPSAPPDYTQPGGSFIVGSFGLGSTIDPRLNFSATFSYLDTSGQLQYLKCSASTVTTVTPPQGWRDTAYGTLSPTAVGLPTGQFRLYQPNGSPLPPITFKAGSLKIAGIAGNWAGKYLNSGAPYTLTFGPEGAYAPQNQSKGPAGTGWDTQWGMLIEQFNFTISSTTTGSTGLKLDLQTATGVLKAGRYDPSSLAVQLTQIFSSAQGLVNYNNQNLFQPNNPLLTRTDGPLNASLIFRRVNIPAGTTNVTFSNTDSYAYWNLTDNQAEPYFVGANTFAVEYGKSGPVYQISYCHTPLSNPSQLGEQDLGIFHYTAGDGKLNYAVVPIAGAVVFHDLQPASFWNDTLGIRDKLVVPLYTDASGVQYYEKSSMLSSTTSGFHGLGSFFLQPEQTGTNTYNDPRKVAPIPPNGTVYVNVTGQSKAIIGETPSENDLEGFFLIECLGPFRRTGAYIDDRENRINIAAIASTQYLSANTVTAFADSGIPYIHKGEPYMISEATVRILDPITKDPAKGLGPNTCIFIQIDRAVQQQPQQAPPQEAHAGVKKE